MSASKTRQELEGIAWAWLMSIQRVEPDGTIAGHRRASRQVMVTAHPGNLDHNCQGGAPMVMVSVDVGQNKRLKGHGNSLARAVSELWNHNPGAPLPPLPSELYHIIF